MNHFLIAKVVLDGRWGIHNVQRGFQIYHRRTRVYTGVPRPMLTFINKYLFLTLHGHAGLRLQRRYLLQRLLF